MPSLLLIFASLLALAAPSSPPPPPLATNPASLPALVANKMGAPLYPDSAQRGRLQGLVAVAAALSPGDITKQISVLRGICPVLDTSCVEAVSHMRFDPIPIESDRPVVFTFRFVLSTPTPNGTYAVSEEFPFSWVIFGYAPPLAPVR